MAKRILGSFDANRAPEPEQPCLARGCKYPADAGRYAIPICHRHARVVWAAVNDEEGLVLTPSPTHTRPQADAGTIYVVRFGDRIKIGYTNNVRRRLKAIPHDEVVATFHGGTLREKELHRQFADHHVKGEWFTAEPDAVAYLRSMDLGLHEGEQLAPTVGDAVVERIQRGKRDLRKRLELDKP